LAPKSWQCIGPRAASLRQAVDCAGYAAFGNSAPGNLISGFGFFQPYWLIDIANAAIFIHLLGAYQARRFA
jgi:hypothetical protein